MPRGEHQDNVDGDLSLGTTPYLQTGRSEVPSDLDSGTPRVTSNTNDNHRTDDQDDVKTKPSDSEPPFVSEVDGHTTIIGINHGLRCSLTTVV